MASSNSSISVWDVLLSKQEASEDTPSRKDGMPKIMEASHRQNYVLMIQEVCSKIRTNPEVPMIAAFYCHRFYAARSMVQNDHFTVATASLFLTFKVSDITMPVRHVLEVSYSTYKRITLEEAKGFLSRQDYYRRLKAKVLQAERSLLYTIGFNFKPILPNKYSFAKINKLRHLTDDQRTTLKQICVNFANDTLMKTTLWLQYQTKELGYAFLHLTAKLTKTPLTDGNTGPLGKEWFEEDGISRARMAELSKIILDMYENPDGVSKGSGKRAASKQLCSAADGGKDAKRPAKVYKQAVSPKAVSPDTAVDAASMSVPSTPDLPPGATPRDVDYHATIQPCGQQNQHIEAAPQTAKV